MQLFLQPCHLSFIDSCFVGIINEDKVAVRKSEREVGSAYKLFVVALITEEKRDVMIADIAKDRLFGAFEDMDILFELIFTAITRQVTVIDRKEDIAMVQLLDDTL